jgi:hypothetical protein
MKLVASKPPQELPAYFFLLLLSIDSIGRSTVRLCRIETRQPNGK